ncbi:response regulator [Nostoc sp. FACHB-152]|uniref:response regulator n=1 Tax=unclassified Nostoc TaxID=2593658 RepID=UPI001681E231|nr:MULTISPECIES: response regulator [unclassified Nostoc]MBD2449033.1 response regulator [Nostoc sp. FACHB-152]MBD2469764.1 response regulator [Nostoc sp. FACHB-145]
MRILLIEDDEVLLDVLLQSLTSQHYVVDAVQDGQSGWEYAQSTSYDLILTDVGLPRLDGIKLCQRLRAEGYTIPILLITAKDASSDRIRGLDAGADDYLTKPLDLAELQARLRALLRRGEVSPTTVLQVGDLHLDPRSCEVKYANKPLKLTPKEYTLLEVFMRNPARVFSRGQLVEHLWTFDDPPLEESVKAHIKGLRQKMKAAGAVDWIENVYGLGYRLREGVGEQNFKSERGDKGDRGEGITSLISSSASIEQEFKQGMSRLWQQYRGLMIERLQALQTAAEAINQGKLTQTLSHSARQAAHKLAGVLGMFEKEAGTLLAREIEEILLSDAMSSAQEQQFLALVGQLGEMLNLGETQPSLPRETPRLLLIDPDLNLGRELQELAQSFNRCWQQVATLELGKTWLQSHSADLVVLATDAAKQQEDSLTLLADLASRTPPISALVLAAADDLLDRVAIARAGGRGFLHKPVAAVQVWEMARQLLQVTQSSTINVLVVDDDPVFLAALRPMLEPWGMRMTGLDKPLRFWEVLRSVVPDLLILDVDMPQVNGIELCQAVRIDPDWQSLPILFLTARCDRATIQQLFTIGADDYVSKPVVAAELLTRITNRLERTRLLQNLSRKDHFTGLANQPHSSRNLELFIQRSKNADRNISNCLSLAVLTITELQQINIEYGYVVGHQVLQQWGRLFQSNFWAGEILGYWGNGDFIVGMPGLTTSQASDRLGQFLTTLRQQVFAAQDNRRFQIDFSFGIAEYPADGATLQSLFQIASIKSQK